MKISIIIPTYKPGDYIWECLDSLEVQTFSKEAFEVILVLNGCKEPYYSQLKEYIAKSAVQYNFIQTDEGGVSNARNIALDNAKGEYITFIDDDDFVSPSYLEELYAKSSVDTMTLCYVKAFTDGTDYFYKYSISYEYDRCSKRGKQRFYIAKKFFSGTWMKLIHRDIIGDRRFDVLFKNGEDSLFMFLISNRFKYVDFTSSSAVYFRRYRLNSAVTRKRSFGERLGNSTKLMIEYTRIYVKHIFDYNVWFYVARLLGTIKSIFSYN